jgi:hypothetical protein
LDPFSVVCAILSSHHARDLIQGLGYACSVPWGINLPEDVAKREVNHARNEKLWARKQRRQALSAAHREARERGEDTPTKLGSLDEDEEGGGEVTPPPLSPPCVTLPPFNDITGRQVGITIVVCHSKQTQTGTAPRLACLSHLASLRYLLTQGG